MPEGAVKSGIFSFFRIFDVLRKIIINLLFWGLIAAAVVFYVKNNYIPEIEDGTTLVIRPQGMVVDYFPSGAGSFLSDLSEDETFIPLRKILTVLDEAASDEKISSVFIDLRYFGGGGLSKLQEIASAVKKVKEAGKTVIAFSDKYTQGSYYIASHAGKVVIDPLGELMFTGLDSFTNYYGKGMEKFRIRVNVFKTGDYKSAVEPFTSEGMSRFSREASSKYLNALWGEYLSGIAKERNKTVKQLENYASGYASILSRHSSSSASAAKENGLVDEISVYNDAEKLAGEGPSIDWEKYYKLAENREVPGEKTIAVVTASGDITKGHHPPGEIGSNTYTDIFENITEDRKISAVVLRIDSGGGGVSASEDIRRALQKVRDSGKPVVVSMSSVAASGAYWISTASDAILCMPTTLTGSIGVFAMLPDFSEFLEKYPGVTTDGYGTTPYSHLYRPDMSMTEDMKKVLQLSVDKDYSYFLSLVSSSRGITVSEAGRAAGGRVWSGKDAAGKKLVDRMGGLSDAVSLAAEKCGCEGKDYSVKYYEADDNWRISLRNRFSSLLKSSRSGNSSGLSLFDSLLKRAAEILLLIPEPGFSGSSSSEDFYNGEVQALYTGNEYIVM